MKILIKKVRSNPFWDKLLRNMIVALSGDSISSIINILVLFISIKIIGNKDYGIFILAQSYMLIFDSIFNFQSWQAIIKFGSKSLYEKNLKVFCSNIKGSSIVDFLSSIFGFILAVSLTSIIIKFTEWPNEIKVIIFISCLEVLFRFTNTPIGILRLANKFEMVAYQKIITSLLRLFSVVFYWLFDFNSLATFTIFYVSANVVGNIVLIIFAFKELKKIVNIKQLLNAKLNSSGIEYYKFMGWTNISSTVDIPAKQLDVFIISTFSIELVTVYKLYKQIAEILGKLTAPLSQVIMPQFSMLAAKKENNRGYEVVLKLKKVTLLFMIPLGIIFSLVAPFILKFYFGNIYFQNSMVMILLIFSRIYSLSYAALHPYFVSIGQVKKNFQIVLCANIFYVLATLVLSQTIGIYGIVIAYLLEVIFIVNMKKKVVKRIIVNDEVLLSG
ncbi:lipopolysaccharide biosynthesis protein [Exiguobacterium oxidotolerans]|uniref:lipopolysaccharide biosynthesis protein n=1 Tax=Exiguobacterium oxidotolerans TaxID=223958 RepID=UPI0004949922|nr:oligosaccharide flippase family protein [Exiguobacterium oxidotolerans]